LSRENVEIVRSAYEAFNRRDMSAMLDRIHPDVELRTTVETHYGHTGVADWIARADEVFDALVMTVEQTIDLDDRVVASVRERAGGKGSGIEIDQHFTHIWTLQAGRVVKFQAYTDRSVALKAVGLEE
jgi:ketosteroid isomerase-like protein